MIKLKYSISEDGEYKVLDLKVPSYLEKSINLIRTSLDTDDLERIKSTLYKYFPEAKTREGRLQLVYIYILDSDDTELDHKWYKLQLAIRVDFKDYDLFNRILYKGSYISEPELHKLINFFKLISDLRDLIKKTNEKTTTIEFEF